VWFDSPRRVRAKSGHLVFAQELPGELASRRDLWSRAKIHTLDAPALLPDPQTAGEGCVLEMEQGGTVLPGNGFKLVDLFERQHAVADGQGFLDW
jgi:hypothetical protein